MVNENVRWEQRFQSFSRALLRLRKYMERGDDLNDLEAEGMIQCFEYTYEMAWLTMKDYHDPAMEFDIHGPRDAIMFAARFQIIDDDTCWTDMLRDRNRTAHTYDYVEINRVAQNIRTRYYPAMLRFKQIMDERQFMQAPEKATLKKQTL